MKKIISRCKACGADYAQEQFPKLRKCDCGNESFLKLVEEIDKWVFECLHCESRVKTKPDIKAKRGFFPPSTCIACGRKGTGIFKQIYSPELFATTWIEYKNNLYLSVLHGSRAYFLSLENGEFVFREFLDVPELNRIFFPLQPDKLKTGETAFIVKMPSIKLVELSSQEPNELFYEITKFIRKYAEMGETDELLMTFYILYTWAYPKTNVSPYYRIISDYGKGKSRFMSIMEQLCFYSTSASGASTAGGMMRMHQKTRGTLFMDESDWKDSSTQSEIIKYINSGFEKGKLFVKCDKENPNTQEVFEPFGPKVFGMRHAFDDQATESRCINQETFELTRKDIDVLLPASFFEEGQVLRDKIARFYLEKWSNVSAGFLLSQKEFSGIEPRILQHTLPLTIILNFFPQGKELIFEYVKRRQQELIRSRSSSFEGCCFNLAVQIAKGEIKLADRWNYLVKTDGSYQAVVPLMIAEQLNSTSKTVSTALKGIGMITHERETVYFKDKDEEKQRQRSVRPLKFKQERRWNEAKRRYYVPDESQHSLEEDTIPEPLKSKYYEPYLAIPAKNDSNDENDAQNHTPPISKEGGVSFSPHYSTLPSLFELQQKLQKMADFEKKVSAEQLMGLSVEEQERVQQMIHTGEVRSFGTFIILNFNTTAECDVNADDS